MLLPKHSMRTLVIIMTACAPFFWVCRYAVAGERWAIAVVAPMLFLVISFALFGAIYLGASALAIVLTPIVRGKPDPNVVEQIIPPVEPD